MVKKARALSSGTAAAQSYGGFGPMENQSQKKKGMKCI